MGKSDSIIFSEYSKFLDGEINHCDSVAFLGFNQENQFTKTINATTRHFYDLQLNNWNINDDWSLEQQYDLIVCTRCAYFSKDPSAFIEKCKSHLSQRGHALIDWGLGDHWRFENYKIGWLRNDEHEFAYKPNNFLYSCYWNKSLLNDENVKSFWECVKTKSQYHYSIDDDLDSVVKKETPNLIDYQTKKVKTIFLWPESPQLYIITLIQK